MVQYYSTLIPADRHTFIRVLATDYNVDQSLVLQLAQNITAMKVWLSTMSKLPENCMILIQIAFMGIYNVLL